MTIISCLSLVDLLAASELPAPFTQLETTSSMHKHASQNYVQGPRLKIQDIEWYPDYVEANVDGSPLRIPGDWIRQNIASNVLQACRYDYGKASLEPAEEWHSPTNALDRFFKVGVEMK